MPAYPLIEFTLSIGSWDTSDEAYPDTGFDSGIAIPVGVGREVLADPTATLLRLADNTICEVESWTGLLELERHRFRIEVVALGNRYLIGREILDQLEICFEFGQRVRLRFGGE